MKVYALEVARGGAKMERSKADPSGGPGNNVRNGAGGLRTHCDYAGTAMKDLALLLLIYVRSADGGPRRGLKVATTSTYTAWTKDDSAAAAAAATDAPGRDCLPRCRSRRG